jgi:hypothetical protein
MSAGRANASGPYFYQRRLENATKLGAIPKAISAMKASSAIGLHREIFFGGGNLTNSSPGRTRSGSSLGTREYGLDTTLASGAGGD